jgi:DNA end-binding protein Ku
VAAADVVKGYEFAPQRFVTVTAAELEELAPEPSRTIDVEQFVQASAVDPIHYETSYFAVPARDRLLPFAVLLEAMRQTESLGICWLTLRRKRHLAALRPLERLMLVTTMFHADEVLDPEGLALPLPTDLSKRERDMAALLIRTLTGPFEPQRYRDEHRRRLLDLLQRRAAALPPEPAPAGPEPAPVQVEELMAALKASVEEARRRRTEGRRANRRGA